MRTICCLPSQVWEQSFYLANLGLAKNLFQNRAGVVATLALATTLEEERYFNKCYHISANNFFLNHCWPSIQKSLHSQDFIGLPLIISMAMLSFAAPPIVWIFNILTEMTWKLEIWLKLKLSIVFFYLGVENCAIQCFGYGPYILCRLPDRHGSAWRDADPYPGGKKQK